MGEGNQKGYAKGKGLIGNFVIADICLNAEFDEIADHCGTIRGTAAHIAAKVYRLHQFCGRANPELFSHHFIAKRRPTALISFMHSHTIIVMR